MQQRANKSAKKPQLLRQTANNESCAANDSRNVMQPQLAGKKKACSDTHSAGNLNKTEYLNEFDSIENGPLHDQSWQNPI